MLPRENSAESAFRGWTIERPQQTRTKATKGLTSGSTTNVRFFMDPDLLRIMSGLETRERRRGRFVTLEDQSLPPYVCTYILDRFKILAGMFGYLDYHWRGISFTKVGLSQPLRYLLSISELSFL